MASANGSSRRAALLGAIVAATAAMLPLVEAQECPNVPEEILSSSCDLCTRGQLCQTKASKCNCFSVGVPALNFLLPFSAVTTASLNSTTLPANEIITGPDDTAKTAWATDDDISKVEQLVLPASTTTVNIRGGNSLTAMYKGVVADVSFVGNFLGGQTQVNQVFLVSLSLASSANNLAGNLPTGVEVLALANDRLTAFPTPITEFKSLKRLFLHFNDITEVSSSNSIDTLVEIDLRSNKISSFSAVYANSVLVNLAHNKLAAVPTAFAKYTKLKRLYLHGNQIKSFKQENAVASVETLTLYSNQMSTFEAYMPNLVYLDLADNAFKTFPSVIFKHTRLTSLFMQMNSQLVDVAFTSEQANFINTLTEFQISQGSLRSGCSTSQQFQLKKFGYTICISGDVDTAIVSGARVVPSTPAPQGLSSDSAGASDSEIPAIDGMSVTLTTPGSNKSTGGTVSSGGSSSTPPSKSSGSTSGSPTSSTGTQDSSSSSIIPIIVGVSVGVVVVVVVIVLYLRRSKSRGKQYGLDANTTTSTLTGVSKGFANTRTAGTGNTTGSGNGNAISLWNDEDLLSLKVSVDDIQDVKRIGSGGFADVWLVKFRKSEFMASKRLRDDATRQQIHGFIEEIRLVSTLKHPSIVELTGVAWVRESDLQALFQYMDSGDLRDYLSNPHVSTQWTLEKVQIAIDIAEALVYVHSFYPPLVHRDLKSRNVLLDANMQAKVTDFGVSRYQSESNTMTAGVGTSRWLAPEVIAGDGSYGAAADMYSFGAVLSEMDTHQIPFDDVRGSTGHKLIDVALLQLVACGELRPTVTRSCPPEIADVANLCLSFSPEDRPAATEVAYRLRTYKKSLTSFLV